MCDSKSQCLGSQKGLGQAKGMDQLLARICDLVFCSQLGIGNSMIEMITTRIIYFALIMFIPGPSYSHLKGKLEQNWPKAFAGPSASQWKSWYALKMSKKSIQGLSYGYWKEKLKQNWLKCIDWCLLWTAAMATNEVKSTKFLCPLARQRPDNHDVHWKWPKSPFWAQIVISVWKKVRLKKMENSTFLI